MIRRSLFLACLAGAALAGPCVAAVEDFAVPAPPRRPAAPPTSPPPPAGEPIATAPPAPAAPATTSPPPAPAPPPPVAATPTTPPDAPPPQTPSPPATVPTAPPPVAGPGPSAPADQVPPVTPTLPPPAPVQAQLLDTLDLFSAGRDAGLGADLWKGSSAAIARAVIPTLADKPLTPAAVGLARRVLSAAATAPEGAGTDADLAAARVRVLLALGDAPAVDAILDRTPGLAGNPALSQLAAEAALITDQPDKACRIGDGLSTGRQAVYWLRLRAYCQARQGRAAEAQLTFTLAGQEGADADYARLMGVVLVSAGAPGAASLRDGLDYALSRQLQLDLAPALAGAPAAIAEHVRALPPPPPPAPPPPPPGMAAPDHIIAPPPPSEADVLAALRAAQGAADYAAAARAEAVAIAALVQSRAPLTAPVQLAGAALIAGDLASAQAIRAGLVQDAIPGAGPVDIAILDAAIAVAAGKPDPQTLDRLAERGGAGDPAARGRAQAAAAIYAPFAGPSSPAVRAALSGFDLGAPGGPAGAELALDLAADARARGDAAMLALELAQAAGAAGPTPADRARLEQALARAGLVDDARAFALEGLIGLQGR
jgi:hypothetical protein